MEIGLFSDTATHFELRQPLVRLSGRTHRVSPVFATYWQFAAERQAAFFRRLAGVTPVTLDPILQQFKFTNAFRMLDRTSQYLLTAVIQRGDQSIEELFFRIILFKLFNKIETWELLLKDQGEIRLATYDYNSYDHALTNESRLSKFGQGFKWRFCSLAA